MVVVARLQLSRRFDFFKTHEIGQPGTPPPPTPILATAYHYLQLIATNVRLFATICVQPCNYLPLFTFILATICHYLLSALPLFVTKRH
jgi:hypothetical protein